MTDSGASLSAAPSKAPSFWEDVIDIFVQPAEVFRRRQFKSAWPAVLFVTIVIGVISYFTFGTMFSMIDGDIKRSMAAQMAKSPQFTQELADKARAGSEKFGPFVVGPFMLITMVVVGLIAWLVGKLVGSKQTVGVAMVVVGWSYMPRVLGVVITAIQALVMDTSNLTSVAQLSLSAARFLDPDKANPLVYQLATRVDLITIWVTVLLAIGLW